MLTFMKVNLLQQIYFCPACQQPGLMYVVVVVIYSLSFLNV